MVKTSGIMQNLKGNHPGEIERICKATWEPLYRFMYYRVQNRQEAEDITQETYVKALSSLQKHNVADENFLGFLKTVALNEMRDRWRQKKRRGIPVYFEGVNFLEAASPDPQKEVARRILLENALAKLGQDQRAVLDLRIVKGYSVAETAMLTGKTEAAVRTAQYRALKNLAELLAENDETGVKKCE